MKKVLIVDDAAFMRLAIKKILIKNGYDVIGEAENGQAGLKKYMELMPDLVTMDITMPEMDGIEALKEIKSFDGKANIIMITALGQENRVREAILSGAKGFIVKPFTEDTVVSAFKNLKI